MHSYTPVNSRTQFFPFFFLQRSKARSRAKVFPFLWSSLTRRHLWSGRDFVSVRAFSQSGRVSVFTADVLGRCFSRGGTVSVLCV